MSGIDKRAIGGLAAGHACADLCQGAVPALLPFLIAQRGLSLTAAAALLTAATLGSSIVQPLFGLVADRASSPWLMPGGVAVAAAGLGSAGLFDSYAALAAALVVSGLGVAAFHPEGARCASRVSGSARAQGMSFFSVGGNAGFALGPLLVALVVATLGLGATPLLAVPGMIVAAWLAFERARLGRLAAPAAAGDGHAPSRAAAWWPFSRLAGAAVARTAAFFALQALVPVYLIERHGATPATAAAALTVLLVAGAIGTLIGGRLADRVGRKPVLVASMIPLTLLLIALPQVPTAPFVVVLAAIGVAADGPFSVTVVLGQEYLPGREGLASGITLGLAIGIGGVLATALGAVADLTSVHLALVLLPAFALAALVLAATLPGTRAVPAATVR
jgi:MFS transporter, FSR family, fosmidomycin resistance protein